jgi:hypothetical protein
LGVSSSALSSLVETVSSSASWPDWPSSLVLSLNSLSVVSSPCSADESGGNGELRGSRCSEGRAVVGVVVDDMWVVAVEVAVSVAVTLVAVADVDGWGDGKGALFISASPFSSPAARKKRCLMDGGAAVRG